MIDIDLKIDCWKNKLLDLGKRNKLIRYHQTKKTSIAITSPDIGDIYKRLVTDKNRLIFKSNKPVQAVHNSLVLSTDRDFQEQDQTLVSIKDKGVSAIKDKGIDVVYTVFGFLNWFDVKSKNQQLVSPLILVPVHISSEFGSSTENFFMRKSSSEIMVNPTLALKLELDYGFVLPKFDSNSQTVTQYLKLLSKQLREYKWAISVADECAVGVFSFLKMNSYDDIELHRNQIKDNNIIKKLCYKLDDPYLLSDNSKLSLLKSKHSCEHNLAFFADKAQQDVVHSVIDGDNVVIIGGAGTGKSLTLSNIISSSLGNNKKILFVAEKTSAVDSLKHNLSSIGLDSYFLDLHNPKIEASEVVVALDKSLEYSLFSDINSLHKKNKKATSACLPSSHQINQTKTTLGDTVYDILCKLNTLSARTHQTLSLNFDGIDDITNEQLNQLVSFIEHLYEFIIKGKSYILKNVWASCSVYQNSKDYPTQLLNACENLYENLAGIFEVATLINNKANIFDTLTISQARVLLEIKDKCKNSKAFPSEWLLYTDFESIKKEINSFIQLQEQIMWANQNINMNSDYTIDDIDAVAMLDSLTSKCDNVRKLLNNKKYLSDEDIVHAAEDLIEKLKFANDILVKAYRYSEYTCAKFGVPRSVTTNDFFTEMQFIKEVIKNPSPTSRWFEGVQKVALNKLLESSRRIFNELRLGLAQIQKDFTENIFTIDYDDILKRFKSEYTGKLLLLNKSYRLDKQIIKACLKDSNTKLEDEYIITALTKVKDLMKTRDWIAKNQSALTEFFGKHYIGEQTNWDTISANIEIFNKIQSRFTNTVMPAKLKEVLIEGIDGDELKNNALLYQLEDTINVLSDELVDVDYTTKDMLGLSKSILYVVRILKSIKQNYDTIKAFHKPNAPYNEIILNLRSVDYAKQCYLKFDKLEYRMKSICCEMYNGVNTNFVDILSRMDFAEIFTQINTTYHFDDRFIRKVCNKENFINSIFDDKSQVDTLAECLSNHHSCRVKYSEFFNDTVELEQLTINQTIDILKVRLRDLPALQAWVTFLSLKEKSEKLQLDTLMQMILEDIFTSQKHCIDSFLYAFYTELSNRISAQNSQMTLFSSTTVANKLSYLQSVEQDYHDKLINNIHEIKQSLLNNSHHICQQPEVIKQISLLKQELAKTKKNLSTRELMRALPELVLGMTPCIITSPLSVSLFLQNPAYHFDLVVFDDASQLATEDVIGAIARGSQIVISGDPMQLPPTNYFTLSDDDSSSISNDVLAKEISTCGSVLDEYKDVLTTKFLRTHYRSNEQSLILFAKHHIYKDRLTTFPSSKINSVDSGVSFVYVADGIYDRGGTNTNHNEAVQVANLIYNSIKKHPTRSISVIVLSEAQQHEIESVLFAVKQSDPSILSFFQDDKSPAFSIKTLENIQGDERDVMIFCIGFGKDNLGILELNFGPLCKKDSDKRLNVAFTRAREQMYLVSSIKPDEIDINTTTSAGIVLLRDYMLHLSTTPQVQSNHTPHEDIKYDDILKSIGQYITNRYGYALHYNLGKSENESDNNIKIDIAVYDKQNPNQYILGIILDDCSDKIELAHFTTLQNSWQLLRMWSYHWVFDKEEEQNRLNSVLSFSTSQISLDNRLDTDPTIAITSDDQSDVTINCIDNELYAKLGFNYYKQTDLSGIINANDTQDQQIEKCALALIREEYPISFDALCKRIGVAIGEPKITIKLKGHVQEIISKKLSSLTYLSDQFYFLKSDEEIPVRIANTSTCAYTRSIQEISSAEICRAMIQYYNFIDKQELSISALYSEIAKLYGFIKVGANIKKALDQAFELFSLSEGIIISGDIIKK